MSTELVRTNGGNYAAPAAPIHHSFAPLPVEDLKRQVSSVMEAMSAVMVPGTHYGNVPGVDKPSLAKPGAEVICMMFRLVPQFNDSQPIDLGNGHREYRFTCTLHGPDGRVMGMGGGSCSTMESKYRYRNGERKCPACGKAAIIKGREEYGGGFVCFGKKGGCGAKFREDDKAITDQQVGRVENPDIADLYNTVEKMARKRAHVDATLRATCASGVFTQDVEDLVAYGEQTKPAPVAEVVVAATGEPVQVGKSKANKEQKAAAPKALPNPWLHKIETTPLEDGSSSWGGGKGKYIFEVEREFLKEIARKFPNKLTQADALNLKAAFGTIKDGTADALIEQAAIAVQDEIPENFGNASEMAAEAKGGE